MLNRSIPIQPKPHSLVQEVAGRMLDAGCDEDQACNMLRVALLEQSLTRTRGNISHAAILLNKHRNRVAQKLREFDLQTLPAAIRKRARSERRLTPRKNTAA